MQLHVTPIWVDDDTMLRIRVELLGNGRQAWHEGFAYPEIFTAFGRALSEFPRDMSDEARLELGSADPAFDGHLLIRAFVHDGAGHCAMEFRGEERGDALAASSVRFSVPTEAASLNDLGHSLIAWASRPTEAFLFKSAGP